MTIVLPTSDNINFQNYPGLIASIESRMDRTDLTADIPNWIYLAEREMERRLEGPYRETVGTVAADSESTPLPGDYKMARAVALVDGPPLTQITPAAMLGTTNCSGRPSHYAIIGQNIYFSPTPSSTQTARIAYRRKIPALTEASPSNWVVDNHPDVYFYGALMQGFAHIADEDRAAAYRGLFDAAIAQVNDEGRDYLHGASLFPTIIGVV